jgi:hypothetical protein
MLIPIISPFTDIEFNAFKEYNLVLFKILKIVRTFCYENGDPTKLTLYGKRRERRANQVIAIVPLPVPGRNALFDLLHAPVNPAAP